MRKVLRTKVGLLLIVAVCCPLLLVAFSKQDTKPAVDLDTYKAFMSAQVSDIYDLGDFFFDQRDSFISILPPASDFILRQSGSPAVLPFTPKSFPPEFVKNLVPLSENSVPVYPITILEDPITRETVFLNAENKEVYALKPPAGYDPFFYLKILHPDLYSARFSKESVFDLESLYDPARIQIQVKLIATQYVEQYLYTAAKLEEEQAKQAELFGGEEGGGMMMLGMEEASNHLWLSIQGPAQGLTNVEIAAHIPSGFTNRLEIFTGTNLLSFWWTLSVTNITTEGTDTIAWADSATEGVDVRFYALGNADIDSDTDGLADGREKFLYHTDPNLSDTDGDGASDGAEVAHGLNPLVNPGDGDADGLSDDLEIVLGTDPEAPDSDLDFASDGYEVAKSTDPMDPDSTPPLSFTINNSDLYTPSTWLSLSFTGVVADTVLISEAVEMNNSVTNILDDNVLYVLSSSTNGWHDVYAQLGRVSDGQRSRVMSSSIILDTVAPAVGITSPTNGYVTARRWIPVSGVATDSVSAVQVLVNTEWADKVSQGSFSQAKLYLTQGTNVLQVVGQDGAGNSATQVLVIVQDTSSDTTAPSVVLDLPRDYEIIGGVTNWFDRTTLGAAEDLLIKGTTDDETAALALRVEAAGETNGPFAGTVAGTQLWGSVKLFPGTNALIATVSDAAGNTSTGVYCVIRDTNFFFEITSPLAYQEMNAPSVTVVGVASPAFLAATITVNGVATEITDHGTNVTFTTITPVPLNLGLTELAATADLNGRSYYTDPPVVGYEVLEWNQTSDGPWDMRFWPDQWGYCTWGGWSSYDQDWNASSRIKTYLSTWEDTWCDYNYQYGWDCEDYSGSTVTQQYQQLGPRSLYFGTEVYREDYIDYSLHSWSYADYYSDGDLRFIKHWPTQETQLVVFQFKSLGYGHAPGVSINPSLITYRGQTGFWFNGSVSFILPLKTETEYLISESDFRWPSHDYTEPHPSFANGAITKKGHTLWFNSFTNDPIRAVVENDPVSGRDTDNLQVQFFTNVNQSGDFEYTAIPLKIYYTIFPTNGWTPDKVELRIAGTSGVIRTMTLATAVGQQMTNWDGKTDSGEYPQYGLNTYSAQVAVTIGSFTCSARHVFSVFEIRQGNCLYRDNAFPYPDWHAGVLYSYTGGNTFADLNDDTKYGVIQHRGLGDIMAVDTLSSFKASAGSGGYKGEHCPPELSGSSRRSLREGILQKCAALLSANPPYVDPWDNVLIQEGSTWEGTIADIDMLRCDGVNEVSYEDAGVRLYGGDAWWNIMTPSPSENLEKHNSGTDSIAPSKQCSSALSRNQPDALRKP